MVDQELQKSKSPQQESGGTQEGTMKGVQPWRPKAIESGLGPERSEVLANTQLCCIMSFWHPRDAWESCFVEALPSQTLDALTWNLEVE